MLAFSRPLFLTHSLTHSFIYLSALLFSQLQVCCQTLFFYMNKRENVLVVIDVLLRVYHYDDDDDDVMEINSTMDWFV